jgi:Uma2 family endonuclease
MVAELSIKSQIIERLKSEDLVKIAASEAEYLSLAHEAPFKIEYHQSEIIAMGLASTIHELILMNIAGELRIFFKRNKGIFVFGSSIGIKTGKFEGSYFQPDITVVKGSPEHEKNSTSIIKNPTIIFEILSPSTQSYDLSEKLEEFKDFDSLELIVFVHQDKMKVTTYQRSYKPVGWFNQDFTKTDDTVQIDGRALRLEDIYEQVDF